MPGSPFDLVKQFDAMRGGNLGGLAPIQPPQPIQQPIVQPMAGAPSRVPAGGLAKGASGGGGNVGQMFQKFDQQFGGTLRQTSGYRTPEHNAEVGGVPNSWHTKKDDSGHEHARDYVGSAGDMQAGAAWAKQNGAQEVLVHNAGSGQHLHVVW